MVSDDVIKISARITWKDTGTDSYQPKGCLFHDNLTTIYDINTRLQPALTAQCADVGILLYQRTCNGVDVASFLYGTQLQVGAGNNTINGDIQCLFRIARNMEISPVASTWNLSANANEFQNIGGEDKIVVVVGKLRPRRSFRRALCYIPATSLWCLPCCSL